MLDVYKHAKEAVDRARSGEGPTLLELKTFRLCGHSRRDPNNYMSDEEKEEWKSKDPLPYFTNILKAKKIFSEKEIADMKKSIEEDVQKAIDFGRESPQPEPADVTGGLYVTMEVPD